MALVTAGFTAFGSPVFFYGLTGFESTFAVSLACLGLVAALTPAPGNRKLLLAGILCLQVCGE